MNIKDVFPNAKLIKTDNPELEDDMIYLTKLMHIQISLNEEMYSLISEKEGKFTYIFESENLIEVYNKATEVYLPKNYLN